MQAGPSKRAKPSDSVYFYKTRETPTRAEGWMCEVVEEAGWGPDLWDARAGCGAPRPASAEKPFNWKEVVSKSDCETRLPGKPRSPRSVPLLPGARLGR